MCLLYFILCRGGLWGGGGVQSQSAQKFLGALISQLVNDTAQRSVCRVYCVYVYCYPLLLNPFLVVSLFVEVSECCDDSIEESRVQRQCLVHFTQYTFILNTIYCLRCTLLTMFVVLHQAMFIYRLLCK